MDNRHLIYKSLQFIEENLKSDMNVFSLSEQFDFSCYYFSRLFKGVTGYPLKDYLLGRRMAESYKEVVNSKRKIIDIAFDYGFNNHESFSRAFKRTLGRTPLECRKDNRAKPTSLMRALTPDLLETRKKNRDQSPELIELDEMVLVGIPFYLDTTMKNDLSVPWANLSSNISLIKNRIVPEQYYQLQYWFADQEPDSVYIFIAVRAAGDGDVPVEFSAKSVPRQKYLKFTHKGKSNTVGSTYQYIYDVYLPETEYRLPHSYNFEHYSDDCFDPYSDESVSEIFIPVEYGKDEFK